MNNSINFLAMFFFALGLVHYSQCKEQSITVTGQVICDKRSMRNVNIELREHDTR